MALDITTDETVIGGGGGTQTSPWDTGSSEFVMVGSSSGSGSLTISNGGVVTSYVAYLGYESQGTVTVTGDTSAWTLTSDIYIVDGALLIENGGAVSNSDARLGTSSGDTGSATVTGSGSSWLITATLGLGSSGTGELLISDGATVTSQGSENYLAYHDGAKGIVTVTGDNSTWSTAADIGVGYGGTGTLTISDGGEVSVNSGTGTVTLGRDSTGTGTLNIGSAAGDTATVAGTLTAGTVTFGAGTGSIVFNHTETDYEFALDVTGDGSLEIYSGTTSLTGDYSYFTGSATVYSGGTLLIDTTFDQAITIEPGGTVGGSGQIASLTLTTGSTFEVGVDSGGHSDTLSVTGTLAIKSGATLSVVAANGTDDGSTYADSTDYTIISAGTLDGEFDTVTDNFAYLDASVTYSTTEATLTLVRTAANLASQVTTPNRRTVATTIENMGSGPLYDAVMTMADGEPEQAFQQLSGESHATYQSTLISSASVDRAVVNRRLLNVMNGVGSGSGDQVAMGFHGEGSVSLLEQANAEAWGEAFGGWGETDATATTARQTSYGGGVLMGIDAEFLPGWRTGVMAGYSRTLFNSSANASSGSANSYHSGLYAGTNWDVSGNALALRMSANYTFHTLSTSRTASFTGFSDRLSADYNAATAQAAGELGYTVHLTPSMALEPFAGLAAIHEHTDGFTETGGAAALTSDDNDDLMGVTTLGVRGEAVVAQTGGMEVSLLGSLAWRHAFGDIDPESTMRFSSGSEAFSVAGTPIDENTALFETGLSLKRNDALSFTASYQGEVGATAQDHTGRLNLRFTF